MKHLPLSPFLLALLLSPMACSDSSPSKETKESKPNQQIFHQEISALNEAKKIQDIANEALKARSNVPEE